MKYGKYVVVLEDSNWLIEKMITMDESDTCKGENDARRIAVGHWKLSDSDVERLTGDCRLKVYMPETHDPNLTPECHPGITPETLDNGE